MSTEVKEKLEVTKSDARKAKKTGKSIRMDEVPEFAHKYMKKYRNQIQVSRGKDYTIKQAYCEYVVEKIKQDLKKV